MTRFFDHNESAGNALEDVTIAVIGYGSQGRAQALNLRDSGLRVHLGLRPNGASWHQAKTDGWAPLDVPEAVKQAQVVMLLVPDPAQPHLFENQVKPHLQENTLLLFSL